MDQAGKIYICATPIGNLSDVSKRLINTLNSVDIIYAEDTRVTSKILAVNNIKTALKRLDENTISTKIGDVIQSVKDSMSVAYCTDAGMPGVSDPGLRIVEAARNANVDVEVIPGPSAAINAYVASGFNKPNFYFAGFLPKKKSAKKDFLKELSNIDAAIIIYESPNRVLDTLYAISEIFKDSRVAVCRELTKLHEEVFVGIIDDVVSEFKSRDAIKGEFVIVIESNLNNNFKGSDINLDQTINFLKSKNLKKGDIAKTISLAFDINKNEAYDYLINHE